jgi:hypothetical protein
MTHLFDGMGGHHGSRSTTDEWLTPPEIIRALGDFDLDPCASCSQTHITGTVMGIGRARYCKCDDGYSKEWKGRVWLNPPYGKETGRWIAKMAKHGNGIALIFGRTDVGWFQDSIFRTATGLLFLGQRLTFIRGDGVKSTYNSGAPSVLVAYGEFNAEALERLQMPGYFVRLREPVVYRKPMTMGGPNWRATVR